MAVKIISLAFMNSDLIEKSFEQLYATHHASLEMEHHVLFQHYPLNAEYNKNKLWELSKRFGFKIHDAGKNLGLHEGLNFIFKKLNLGPDDIVICFDPDSYPVGYGWDLALVRAIQGSKDVVWSSLLNPRCRGELQERGYDQRIVDGHLKLWVTRKAVVNSVCAFKMSWLKEVGLLSEPRPFYGHLEAEMFSKLGKNKWAFVEGWTEKDDLRDMHDRAYVLYKWAHAHLKIWDGDFVDWLKAGSPMIGEAPEKLP